MAYNEGRLMNKGVSVLIPVYNNAEYIGKAIESVLDQTFKPFEIIVADDGSEDGSGAIAASYPGVRCISLTHQGVAAARNRLLEVAGCEWISFLDADDLWVPEKLEKQMLYISEHPDCDMVFCQCKNFTELDEKEMTQRQKYVLTVEIEEYMTGACIRKSLFDRYGFFDTNYKYGEDTEWISRLKISGVDTSHRIDEYLYLRRIHADNITLSHGTPNRKEYLTLMADAIRNARKKEK